MPQVAQIAGSSRFVRVFQASTVSMAEAKKEGHDCFCSSSFKALQVLSATRRAHVTDASIRVVEN